MNDLLSAADAAMEYLKNSMGLADLAGRKGPETTQDAMTLGQLYALIAIATELSRIADQVEIANGKNF